MTRAVHELMQSDKSFALFVQLSLGKYVNCDWGSIDDEDKKLNDGAVTTGEDRIHAAYVDSKGRKIWIITERDHSVTTVLFPSDY